LSSPSVQRKCAACEEEEKKLHRKATPSIQRKCAACDEENHIHRKESSPAETQADSGLNRYVNSLGSSGHPLPESSRKFFEPRFGQDFSKVRVHADSGAAKSAKSINALAYTTGNNIVFNEGQYAPGSQSGQRLMAHELTHVVQQGGANLMIARASKSSDVYYKVNLPEGEKILTAAEYEQMKQKAIRNLRNKLHLVISLASDGRDSQIDMLKDYQGGVESLKDVFFKPKALIGIFSDMKAGVTPPYIGMWNSAKNLANMGIAALDKGNIVEAAHYLTSADKSYHDSMHEWNAYREATIGGAAGVISNLETVRDVSFAIALAAGAAVAAPVIAGAVGVGGLGLTGASATALTATGTAVTTGALGVGLGGGSSALGSYASTGKVDIKAAQHDAIKFGKQGLVTGLTAGLGTALGAGGKAAELGKPFIQQALRKCATDAGINVTGEITTKVLDQLVPPEKTAEEKASEAQTPKPLLPGPARSAITGCITGVLGVPASKIKSDAVKKGVELGTGAAVGFADAKLAGQDNLAALGAAAQGTLTSLAIGGAKRVAPGKKSTASETEARTPAEPPIGSSETAGEVTGARKQMGPAKHPEDAPAPAVAKKDALVELPIEDGHEVVVTKRGVARCSPSPCPVIHVEYAKELAEFPELKKWNEKIQGLRKTNPAQAASEAEGLIRTLEAKRKNAQLGDWNDWEKHLQQDRKRLGNDEGMLAAGRTDIPFLKGKTYKGASAKADGPNLKGTKNQPTNPQGPTEQMGGKGKPHAEGDVLNQVATDIDQGLTTGKITEADLEGKTVRVAVEDKPCPTCATWGNRDAIDAQLAKTPDGILLAPPSRRVFRSSIFQFSYWHQQLTVEIVFPNGQLVVKAGRIIGRSGLGKPIPAIDPE
jgi:hypothetical protein